MQNYHEKKTKSVSEQEAEYDRQLIRNAKESYHAFSVKVAEKNASHNFVINYPIHWQFGESTESAKEIN